MSSVVWPYPGLRAFARDESHLFFGREGCVDRMIERLAATRFLAVLGASGSGKSSMVRTGLLDGLELGFHAQAGSRWKVVDTHPGGSPLRNLAAGLVKAAGGKPGTAEVQVMRALLARGPRSLVEWCKARPFAPGTNLLILVDQFEELFRYADYAAREEAEAFSALLLESAQAAEVPIHIVLTMRSEYLGACALIPGLAEAINSGFYLTPRMTREECRSAIEGPASVCGFSIEPALVNTMLNDMAGFAPWEEQNGVRQSQVLSRRADQLPLMQHVLNRLWLKASRQAGSGVIRLTLADYENEGRLTGALDAHGAEVLAALEPSDRARASVVLRCLVSGPDLANAVRRPCRFSEIASEVQGGEAPSRRIIEVLRANGCNFLMPPPPRPIELDTVIDIGHESLIRQWSVMSALLQTEARAGAEWERLRVAALRYEEGRGSLLSGPDVAATQLWWESDPPTESWALRHGGEYAKVSSYLRKSLGVQEAARAEEERREQHERARLKKQRNLYLLFALTLLPLLLVSVFLGHQVRGRAAELEAEKAQVAKLSEDREQQLKALQLSSAEVTRRGEEVSLANARLEQKNQTETALRTSLNDQFVALGAVYKRLRPYQDYILLSEAMTSAGFVRNPKISTDVLGIALSGYDPVSYFQGKEPRIGSPKLFKLHNGAVWLFASEENRSRFIKEPDRYMPAFGGFCAPCLYSEHWRHGRPMAWNIVDDKLYLASTPDLAEEFRKDTLGYLSRAKPNFEASKGFALPAQPNVPTAVGKVLQSYILALKAPDAHKIIQQSAADFAKMGNHYAAATQQREAIALLMNSSDIERRRRDAPDALLLLSTYRLRDSDFAGAQSAAEEGFALSPNSANLRVAVAVAMYFDPAKRQQAVDLLKPLLGKYQEESELFWEEALTKDLGELAVPNDYKEALKTFLDSSLATPRNCNRLRPLANQEVDKRNWPAALQLQGQYASCLARLPSSSKRVAREVPDAYLRLGLIAMAAHDYAAVQRAAAEGSKLTPNEPSLQVLDVLARALQGQPGDALKLLQTLSPSGSSGKESLEASFKVVVDVATKVGVKPDVFADLQQYVDTSIEFAKLDDEAIAMSEARKFADAGASQEKALRLLSTLPLSSKVRMQTARGYAGLAWYRLMSKQAPAALAAVESGLAVEPNRTSLLMSKAHALLLTGRLDEAETIYTANRGSKLPDGTAWEARTLNDLTELEREYGTISGASRIRALFK